MDCKNILAFLLLRDPGQETTDRLFFSVFHGNPNINMWCYRAHRDHQDNNSNNGCYCDDKGIGVFCWTQHKCRKCILPYCSDQKSLELLSYDRVNVAACTGMISFLCMMLTEKTFFQRGCTIIFWTFIKGLLYLSFSYASLTSKWCGKIVGSGSMKNRTILICPIWHININKRCLKRNALKGFHLLI